jgi:hypothetical protein
VRQRLFDTIGRVVHSCAVHVLKQAHRAAKRAAVRRAKSARGSPHRYRQPHGMFIGLCRKVKFSCKAEEGWCRDASVARSCVADAAGRVGCEPTDDERAARHDKRGHVEECRRPISQMGHGHAPGGAGGALGALRAEALFREPTRPLIRRSQAHPASKETLPGAVWKVTGMTQFSGRCRSQDDAPRTRRQTPPSRRASSMRSRLAPPACPGDRCHLSTRVYAPLLEDREEAGDDRDKSAMALRI